MPRRTPLRLVILLTLAPSALIAQSSTTKPAATSQAADFQRTYWKPELAGQAAMKKEDYATAKKDFTLSRAAAEKAGDSVWQDLAGTISELGVIAREQQHYPEAEQLFQQALALHEKHDSADDPALGNAVQGLANIYMAEDEPAKAEPLLLRTVDIYKKAFAAASDATTKADYGNHIAWCSFWLIAMATSSNRPDVAKSRCDDGMKYIQYFPTATQRDIMTRGCTEVASHAKP